MRCSVLTIAGSDSCGRAGIQRDLFMMTQIGCHGLTAIAAVTIQNRQGVQAIYPLPASCLEQQVALMCAEPALSAIKIGMLYTADNVHAVARQLRRIPPLPIVLDPVLHATSGAALVQQDALPLLIRDLFPLATLVTPNLFEAEQLVGYQIPDAATMERAVCDLLKLCPRGVLLKGGHLSKHPGQDLLGSYTAEGKLHLRWLRSHSLPTVHPGGLGCALSTAIACFLGKGLPLEQACTEAKQTLSPLLRGL